MAQESLSSTGRETYLPGPDLFLPMGLRLYPLIIVAVVAIVFLGAASLTRGTDTAHTVLPQPCLETGLFRENVFSWETLVQGPAVSLDKSLKNGSRDKTGATGRTDGSRTTWPGDRLLFLSVGSGAANDSEKSRVTGFVLSRGGG